MLAECWLKVHPQFCEMPWPWCLPPQVNGGLLVAWLLIWVWLSGLQSMLQEAFAEGWFACNICVIDELSWLVHCLGWRGSRAVRLLADTLLVRLHAALP